MTVCVYIPDGVYLIGGKSHSKYIPVIPPSHAPQPGDTHVIRH